MSERWYLGFFKNDVTGAPMYTLAHEEGNYISHLPCSDYNGQMNESKREEGREIGLHPQDREMWEGMYVI